MQKPEDYWRSLLPILPTMHAVETRSGSSTHALDFIFLAPQGMPCPSWVEETGFFRQIRKFHQKKLLSTIDNYQNLFYSNHNANLGNFYV